MPNDVIVVTPTCSHPRATFKIHETYGNGSAYGTCGTCGKNLTLPKDAA